MCSTGCCACAAGPPAHIAIAAANALTFIIDSPRERNHSVT
jgi:hypothetical protein